LKELFINDPEWLESSVSRSFVRPTFSIRRLLHFFTAVFVVMLYHAHSFASEFFSRGSRTCFALIGFIRLGIFRGLHPIVATIISRM
jgi:hypothetical protein